MSNSMKFLYQVSKKELINLEVGTKLIPMRSKPMVELISPVTLPWSISWEVELIEPAEVDSMWYWKSLRPVLP